MSAGYNEKMRRKRIVFGVAIAAIVIIFAAFLFTRGDLVQKENKIKIGNSEISVEIARTDAEQAKGLGGRSSLDAFHGMLFVFTPPTIPGFWMKDMSFPIDIVWISENRVIGVIENADPQIGAPESKLKIYTPPSSVDSVIELSAGTFKASNARVGDTVDTSRFLIP